MKIFTLLLTLSLSTLIAQEYQKGKIDMHGGNHTNYNSIGGYKDGGFRKQTLGMASFLDKNTSKKRLKKKTKEK